MSAAFSRRRAGVLIPLFSCPSTASWGIGDIGDVAPVTAWLAGAGQRVLQLLPLNEMAGGGTSPYSATSAMAIDPIFIRVTAVPEFAAIGGEHHQWDDGEGQLNAQDYLTENQQFRRAGRAIPDGDDRRRHDRDGARHQSSRPCRQANINESLHDDLSGQGCRHR